MNRPTQLVQTPPLLEKSNYIDRRTLLTGAVAGLSALVLPKACHGEGLQLPTDIPLVTIDRLLTESGIEKFLNKNVIIEVCCKRAPEFDEIAAIPGEGVQHFRGYLLTEPSRSREGRPIVEKLTLLARSLERLPEGQLVLKGRFEENKLRFVENTPEYCLALPELIKEVSKETRSR